jgi:ferric-dicitrate binding protein FerR (iron transport regulator)
MANGMEVQVLGTHFDIMAYDNENSINTTLLEGSVKISKGLFSKLLLPGQESKIDRAGNIKVVKANIDEVIAWKNGWFQFNSSGIEKIMRQISRWYNVEPVYEGAIPEGHFSGIVSRDNNITQVLQIMQSGGVQFRIEGRNVIIKAN